MGGQTEHKNPSPDAQEGPAAEDDVAPPAAMLTTLGC